MKNVPRLIFEVEIASFPANMSQMRMLQGAYPDAHQDWSDAASARMPASERDKYETSCSESRNGVKTSPRKFLII